VTLLKAARERCVAVGPIIPREAREKIFALIFSYQDGLSWHIRTLKTRKRCFQTIYLKPSISSSVNRGHVAANQSDERAAEFVNIGRNVVVALKSEGWCDLSPIADTGSRDEYITITQEYNCRRELTQSSCPKETRG